MDLLTLKIFTSVLLSSIGQMLSTTYLISWVISLAFMIMNLKIHTNYGNSTKGLPRMKHYFNWFKVPL